MVCQDDETGGLAERPGVTAGTLHTYLVDCHFRERSRLKLSVLSFQRVAVQLSSL